MISKRTTILVARSIIVFMCIGLLIFLLPWDRDLETSLIFYGYIDKDHFLSNLLGVEWAVLASLVFLIALLLWHTIFWTVIKGGDFFFGLIPRYILLKSFDYFWYTIGLASLLVSLIGFNAEEARKHWEYHDKIKDDVWGVVFDSLINSEEPCLTIMLADDQYEPKNDILFFKEICELLNNDFDQEKIKEKCLGFKIWNTWGTTEDPAYWRTNDRPDSLTNSMNHMHLICNGYQKIDRESNTISIYRNASNRIFNTPQKRNNAILIFFTLFISLRLVKTSSEFAEALRNHKNMKKKA